MLTVARYSRFRSASSERKMSMSSLRAVAIGDWLQLSSFLVAAMRNDLLLVALLPVKNTDLLL